MMNLSLQVNLEQRLELIQKLGLDSRYFESCLVRTENALKKLKNQRGLKLLPHGQAENYRSVLDWLLGIVAPQWDWHIQKYYADSEERLIDAMSFDEISEIDQLLETVVLELGKTYSKLLHDNWLRKGQQEEPGEFLKRTTLSAVRTFATPHFMGPPRPEKIAV